MLAIQQKRALTWNDISSQTALELPERETPQTVILGCLAVCVGQITIRNVDVDVAAQICAAVQALNITLAGFTGTQLTCTQRGTQ